MKIKLILTTVLSCLFIGLLSAQTPAFPGAEGGGKYTTGGRGGKILYVTSLKDDASVGTFRWAVNQSGARTIVFKVSGIIELKSKLDITQGNLTIAGQTAPGDGICIKDYEVQVRSDNVIIRYMRFRLGDEITTHEPDALWGRYRTNVIIDHCSVSWSIDECSSFYSNKDFTMQWCFITESLNQSLHEKGNHGYGAIWGGNNATFHHNLLAHHNSRNPRLNGYKRSGLSYTNPQDDEIVDYRNNVLYNWGQGNSAYGGEAAGKYNMVANYYKYGPGTKSSIRSRIVQISLDKGTPPTGVVLNPKHGKFYITDNFIYGNANVTKNNWNGGVNYDSGVTQAASMVNVPFECTPISQHTAEIAYEKVLAYAGASLVRDAVDTRIVKEVETGTATYKGSKSGYAGIIDSQIDVGGWPEYNSTEPPVDTDGDGIPDDWEDAHGLDKNDPADGNLENAEGYTNLEVYLNSLVGHITTAQLEDAILTSIDSEFTEKETLLIRDNTIYTQAEQIEVFSLEGKLVSSARNVESLYIGDFTKGIYLIKVKDVKGNFSTYKIIR